jgi:SnoaL-like protein
MTPASQPMTVDTVAPGARPPTPAERAAMLELVARHDSALDRQDYAALLGLFHPAATGEFKPAGVRLETPERIVELHRRSSTRLAELRRARRKLREWLNQTGVLREWSIPLVTPSGEAVDVKQLEIIEFTADLAAIRAYRVRMDFIQSALLLKALGDDFLTSPGVERIPG